MPLNIQKLLELARLVRNLGGIVDLEAVAALVKAVLPLPATDADVGPWLARIGITPPLAPIAQGIIAKFLPDAIPAPSLAPAIVAESAPGVALPSIQTIVGAVSPLQVEICEAHPDGVTDEDLAAYGDALTAQAVPVWVVPVVLEVVKLLAEWWKNRKQ